MREWLELSYPAGRIVKWENHFRKEFLSSHKIKPIFTASAAAKSLQSCPTRCDPTDSSTRKSTLRYLPQRNENFSSVTQSCPTRCDTMDCSTPGLPVQHQLPEFTQTHVHWVGDAIQPSHPLSSPSPPALNLAQHQGLFKRVSSSHQVAKVVELQLQHQSFQWTRRTDLL